MSKVRWLVLLFGSLCCGANASAQDVVLVVNMSVRISEIREADLRAIFLGRKTRFADGSRAVPVILKGGPAHEVFLQKHLGESQDGFRSEWQKVVFTGQGAMPKAFDSESAIIAYVAATPGAVGYVSRFSSQENVKAVVALK
jgi:ABC-type phosphate transport system substrate-binding protein